MPLPPFFRTGLADILPSEPACVKIEFMNPDTEIEVPPAWTAFLETEPRNSILIIGGPDTGKSTFVRWLVRKLARKSRLAWLDCDIGQSTLGLPSTLNLALVEDRPSDLPPASAVFFVGSISPRGHMLPQVVGAERLRKKALEAQVNCMVIDTTGMVDADTGGGALKQWKIELLQPDRIVALAHDGELDHILAPLENAAGPAVYRMLPAEAVRKRQRADREDRRRRQYRRYFSTAVKQRLPVAGLPLFDADRAGVNSLLSLQNAAGFSLGLAIALELKNDTLELLTPVKDAAAAAGVRFGSLKVEPGTWREQAAGP